MTRCLTAAACLSLVVSSAAFAADNPKKGMSLVDQKVMSMTPPADSKQFAMKAAESGMCEVQLGKLAQTKGTSDQVKQLGRMLEQEHSQANQELMSVAKAKNIDLPTTVGEDKQAELDAFGKLEGKAFDNAFLLHNIKGHLKSVMMFRTEAQNGTDPEIKAWAAKTLPALQKHTSHIAQVAQANQIPVEALTTGSRMGAGSGTDTAQPAGGRIQGTNDSGTAGSTGTGTSGSGTSTTPKTGTGTGGSK
ncbi:MAG TPA: DUF4142 domain-containing protein [Tepidisphaeraceae bacterium]|nr:DUF4142 domain-containing protein [Tepidisphaeraceae bacterium]